MGLEQLPVGKSHTRDDEEDALKNRVDHEALSRLELWISPAMAEPRKCRFRA